MNEPSVAEIVARDWPVSVCRRVTWAAGIAAPLASCTVPETCEVETAWDHAVTQATEIVMASSFLI